MKHLHPRAKILFFSGNFFAFLFFAIFVSIWGITPIAITLANSPNSEAVVLWLVIFGFFALLLMVFLSYVFAKWNYDNYLYELGDKEIKIKKGVLWKTNTFIPYIKVQNVDIAYGPITGWLGLANVSIQTAGSSANFKVEGYIPYVSFEEAERIREEILNKVNSIRANSNLIV